MKTDATWQRVSTSTLRATFGDNGLEVLTWDEALPEMRSYIEVDANFNYIFSFVLFIVVAFGIANSFLMVVMERVREIGLLGALGLTPGRIGKLLLVETAFLALFAMSVGLAIGYSLHLYLAEVGINLSDLYGGDMEISGVTLIDTVIRSRVNPVEWFVASVATFVLVFCASLYPAWRASRLQPADAMRHYE